MRSRRGGCRPCQAASQTASSSSRPSEPLRLDQLGLMSARGLRRRLVRTRELPKARSQVIKAPQRRELDHRLVCLGKAACSPTWSTTARWHSRS